LATFGPPLWLPGVISFVPFNNFNTMALVKLFHAPPSLALYSFLLLQCPQLFFGAVRSLRCPFQQLALPSRFGLGNLQFVQLARVPGWDLSKPF
jgi:hypothetical protein